jgi:hypothetical protein
MDLATQHISRASFNNELFKRHQKLNHKYDLAELRRDGRRTVLPYLPRILESRRPMINNTAVCQPCELVISKTAFANRDIKLIYKQNKRTQKVHFCIYASVYKNPDFYKTDTLQYWDTIINTPAGPKLNKPSKFYLDMIDRLTKTEFFQKDNAHLLSQIRKMATEVKEPCYINKFSTNAYTEIPNTGQSDYFFYEQGLLVKVMLDYSISAIEKDMKIYAGSDNIKELIVIAKGIRDTTRTRINKKPIKILQIEFD